MSNLPATRSEQARAFAEASKADNTKRRLRHEWASFETWCEKNRKQAMPAMPATVALYITDMAVPPLNRATGTIEHALSTIGLAHRIAGHDDPSKSAPVASVLAGIRRTKGRAAKSKKALLLADMRLVCREIRPKTLAGFRDKALIIVGWAGAFRRSELAAILFEDVEATKEGMVITINRSKTDQYGLGVRVGIPRGKGTKMCPVRALTIWLKRAGIKNGAIFRGLTLNGEIRPNAISEEAIALIVKKRVKAAGFDPKLYSAHSLRSGLITQAAMAGVQERDIMRQSRHKTSAAMRGYIQEASLFRENAAEGAGL